MTFDELALDLINKTNGFTELNGAYKVVSKADVQNAETILRTYYQNVDKKKLDYTNNDAEGIDYMIRFDTPLYNFDLEESIKMNEDYVIKPTYRTKGVTREDVEKYAELLGLDYETALRRWKMIQAPESNYERVLDRLEPVDEAIEKHDTLNPKLWDENNELKPEVRKKIEEIVQKFDNNLKENDVELDVKDICIIGSNANYNYSPDSDVDIHIIADTSVYPDQEDLAMKVYLAYKSLFNNKYDPMLNGIEAEVYVEPDAVKANSNGIYSLNDGWLKEPEQVDVPDIDPEHVQELVKPFEDRYNEVKVNPTIEDVDELIDDIYLQRQKSIMNDGEFGDGNICFKEFRNRGYLQDLRDLKVELENEEMSLNTFGEGVTRVFDLDDNELDLNEDIDLKAGQIFENGPEHTIEIISIDDDLVNYKEKDGNNEYEDTEYLPRLNAMLSEYGFKLAESLNEVKDVVPLDEDVWSNDNGTEFSFPNVRDTLAVYLEWEGIIGEAFLDDIMDFAEAGYDALSDYLDEEGIYGYTERIYNIFNGEPAWCSQMDEDDFVSVCRALYIDPNDAINYDDLTEDKDDVKVIFNPNYRAQAYESLGDDALEYDDKNIDAWKEAGFDVADPQQAANELNKKVKSNGRIYSPETDNSLKEGYNRLSRVFNTKEEADDFVEFLDPDLEPRIDMFDHEDMDHSVKTWYRVYYWDPVDFHEDELDESLNEDIKSGQRFVSPEKDEILVVDGPREDGQIRYHYEDNDGNIIDGHYTVDNYSMLNNYLKSSNFKSVDESLEEGDYLGSKRDLTRDEKKMYLRSIPKFRVIPHPGNHIHKKPFTVQSGRHYQTVDDVYKDYPKDEYDVELVEDIVKLKNGKWANKGKEGTHGEVKTKKAAREQQKAMFANGYHEDLNEDIDQQTKKLASSAYSGYELMELIGTRDDIAYELHKEGIISDDVYSDFNSIIGGMTDDEYEMGYYESLDEAKKVGLVSAAKWALRKASERLKDKSPEEVYNRALEIAGRSEYPFVKDNLTAKKDIAIDYINKRREAVSMDDLDEDFVIDDKPGTKYQNKNGIVIEVIEPTADGLLQYEIIEDDKILDRRAVKDLKSFARMIDANGYKKLTEDNDVPKKIAKDYVIHSKKELDDFKADESLNESRDHKYDEYEGLNSTIKDSSGNIYYLYRKILKDENGRIVKGLWAAAPQDTTSGDRNKMYGPDESKMFNITYDQARGLEPLPNDHLFGLRKELGRKLLPNESLDEGTFFDSMPGYMTPEEVRAFNREKEAKAKAEKDAARAEKKAAAKEKAKAERERQKRIDQREKVNNLSYDSLADMAGLDEDNNDLTKDELLAVLRSNMSDAEILKMHKKMFEDYEVGISGGPYENDLTDEEEYELFLSNGGKSWIDEEPPFGEESNDLNEADEVDIKAKALASNLGIDVSEVEQVDDCTYEADGGEYRVCTEEEAYKYAVEDIKGVFEDMGIQAFTPNFQNWILNNAIDMDAVNGIIDDEIDYFENSEDDPEMLEYLRGLNNDDDKVQFIKDLYGDSFSIWAKDYIDIDKVAEEAIKEDGVAHFVAYYDDDEVDLGNGLYAYRID